MHARTRPRPPRAGGLPASWRLNDELFLCHGTPRSDCEYFLDTQAGPALRTASRAEIAAWAVRHGIVLQTS